MSGALHTPAHRRLVEEIYAEDFALFDYPTA